jgi:predicted small lipoprotein YifL
MRSFLSAALLLALAASCRKGPPADEAAADANDEEIKPVYAAGEAVPAAQQLCDVLYTIPAERRAACCHGKPPPDFGLSQCVVTLSAALRSGAVSLEAKPLEVCKAAQAKALEGCDWVGPYAPPPAVECQNLLRGARKAKELCRSSLECLDGQTCLGVGPTQAGRCGPPKQDGQACRLAVDALAGYLLQEDDRRHPECQGVCGHYRCAPQAASSTDAGVAAAPSQPKGPRCF